MRYHLAHSRDIKKNRWNNICPSCGQRKFSPYIDTVTGKPIAEKECGRCCRERSCAYHMPPREWFKDNPPEQREWLPREQYIELMRQRRRETEQAKQAPLLSPQRGTVQSSRYEVEEYSKRMDELCLKSRSDQNHLARWLATRFPEEQVAQVLARYRTGSTRDGRIIYWQIDEQGQVRAGKVMAYDPTTGHRVKESSPPLIPPKGEGQNCDAGTPPPWGRSGGGQPPVCWVHSMKIDGIKFDEMLAPQCLFGLHLPPLLSPQGGMTQSVRSQSSPLGGTEGGQGWEGAIVESEKTALIMSLVCPDRVWLATGGKQSLKETMLRPLIGYEVEVYPDADALADWYTRTVEMNRTIGTHLHIPTWYYDLMNHDEARNAGLDLADILMSEE